MLRRLHGHASLFVQLHAAIVLDSERVALEMEYIHDAVAHFNPKSETELKCYMRSLLQVRGSCLIAANADIARSLGAACPTRSVASHPWRYQALQCAVSAMRGQREAH